MRGPEREALKQAIAQSIGGSRVPCEGNPRRLFATTRERPWIIDLENGKPQVICPRRTQNGNCDMRNVTGERELFPCIQPLKEMPEPEIISFPVNGGTFTYDVQSRMILESPSLEQPVQASKSEAKLLEDLLRHPGETRSYGKDHPYYENTYTKNFIRRLRRRIGDPKGKIIQTVRGGGYRFAIEESETNGG